jgi:hypothetical protein
VPQGGFEIGQQGVGRHNTFRTGSELCSNHFGVETLAIEPSIHHRLNPTSSWIQQRPECDCGRRDGEVAGEAEQSRSPQGRTHRPASAPLQWRDRLKLEVLRESHSSTTRTGTRWEPRAAGRHQGPAPLSEGPAVGEMKKTAPSRGLLQPQPLPRNGPSPGPAVGECRHPQSLPAEGPTGRSVRSRLSFLVSGIQSSQSSCWCMCSRQRRPSGVRYEGLAPHWLHPCSGSDGDWNRFTLFSSSFGPGLPEHHLDDPHMD